MKTYFAYGSNMNIEQMMRRCPDSHLIGVGVLKGYSLTFKGSSMSAVATIEPNEDSEVPVVMWSISEMDEKKLDIYEGFPRLYIKRQLKVHAGKKTVSGFAYIMTDGKSIGLPSTGYFDIILEGYEENGIDTKPLFGALYDVKSKLKCVQN